MEELVAQAMKDGARFINRPYLSAGHVFNKKK